LYVGESSSGIFVFSMCECNIVTFLHLFSSDLGFKNKPYCFYQECQFRIKKILKRINPVIKTARITHC